MRHAPAWRLHHCPSETFQLPLRLLLVAILLCASLQFPPFLPLPACLPLLLQRAPAVRGGRRPTDAALYRTQQAAGVCWVGRQACQPVVGSQQRLLIP